MMGLEWFDLPVAMEWRHVLFENYPVEPSVVDAHLPDPLTVDTYDGQAWLSVVPFINAAVRPRGIPRRVGFDLPELNLRTYVTHGDGDGVYFFSLDADGLFGVLGARVFHHLPYYLANMEIEERDGRVEFWSRRRHPGARPADYVATYEPTGERYRADPGSLAAFLTERYRYYTETPGGELRYAAVDHERWPLADAKVTVETNRLFEANGFARPDAEPRFLYSPAVSVTASGSKRP